MADKYTLVSPGGTPFVFDVERMSERPNGDLLIESPDGTTCLVPISTWPTNGCQIKAASKGGGHFRLDVANRIIGGTPVHASAGTPKLSADFAKRVADREIDLLEVVDAGIPDLQYLPGAEGIFLRNRRHLIAAPAKSGKSLSTQVHVLHMVQAGAKVIVLDRENARDIYARRLDSILKAWGDSPAMRKGIRDNYHYVEFPTLTAADGPELVAWAQAGKADLVVFDSQRMFLTDQDLNEDDADDYSKFMGSTIDPLFEAGIATLILDNTGHTNEGRSRGSSAKRDLNEILFTLKTTEPFSDEKQGRVQLTLAPGDSRLGHHGEWTMGIGGGQFESWRQVSAPVEGSVQIGSGSGTKTKAQKAILARVKKGACSKRKAVKDSTGKGAGKDALERAVDELIADGSLVRDEGGNLHVAK